MNNLYYALTVLEADTNPSECSTFRKRSPLPFPSPVGTRLFLCTRDGLFTEVHFHVHDLENGGTGDFYMALVIENKPMFLNRSREHTPQTFESETELKDIYEQLIETGWEEMDSHILCV